MNDGKIEREIRGVRSKEMIESPLQCVDAVFAVVDSDHHNWFL